MATYIRVSDEEGAIFIDRNKFPYGELQASHYNPPSNSILISNAAAIPVVRAEWDVFRDVNGNVFGIDLLSSVTVLNNLFAGSGGGGVTDVTATAPVTSTGGSTPDIGITRATALADGSMSSTDKLKLDSIASGAEVNVNADWNSTTGDSQILNKPTVPSELSDLSDVNTGNPADGQILKYNASQATWRSNSPNLSMLQDVTTSGASNQDVLVYNASTTIWEPQAQSGGGGGTDSAMLIWAFFDTSIRDVYIPLTNESEQQSVQRFNRFVSPFDGRVDNITFQVSQNMSGGTSQIDVMKQTVGSAVFTTLETVTFTSTSAYVSTTLTYSTASNFNQGDILVFKLYNGFTTAWFNIYGTIKFLVT